MKAGPSTLLKKYSGQSTNKPSKPERDALMRIAPAEVHGEDYAVSHDLNRVARITAAGHAGQILLSAAVAELVSRVFFAPNEIWWNQEVPGNETNNAARNLTVIPARSALPG